ncbi:MAG: hypothetical protein C5B52_05015 [Bacteroidetes bacterium]|nr:MAG: hypothetical protein C5B52_05015 [Bacteroidota bacterium]
MNRDEPNIVNQNAEAYYVVWARTRDRAKNALQKEARAIVGEAEKKLGGISVIEKMIINDASIGIPELTGEKAFLFFTEIARGLEERLELYCKRYSTDALVLHYHRDIACNIFAETEPEYLILSHQLHIRFNRAVAAYAIDDNTVLPDELGTYNFEITDEFAVDMHVIRSLCLLKERSLNSRRKCLYGGFVTFDENAFPRIMLPAHEEHRLKIFLDRARGGSGIFSRVGFSLPFINPRTDALPTNDDRGFFLTFPSRFYWNDPSDAPQYELVSDVRLYTFALVDIRKIKDILKFFSEPIEYTWGVPADEIVSVTFMLAHFAQKILFESGEAIFRYEMETKAVISMETLDAESYVSANLSYAMKEICGKENISDPSQIVRRFLSRFALPEKIKEKKSDAESSQENSADEMLVPFLFRADDKLLIDMAMIPAFFSSLANALELSSAGLEKKGFIFENQVRDFISSNDKEIKVISSMERSFKENGIVVGEADVVVQKEDTAFLIECKSHRAKSTDQSFSFNHARQRLRSLEEWAGQAHRTAAYLATHPSGKNHVVPGDIKWIIPIVCTPMIEYVWKDDKNLFLIKDELPINMTTNEISEFINSEKWKNNPGIQKYEVENYVVLTNRSIELFENGSLKESLDLLEKILSICPLERKFEIYDRMGLVLRKMGRSEEAVAAYKTGLELNSHDPELLEHYGISMYYARKYEDAIDAYQKAIKIKKSPFLYVHLANSLDASGKFDEAINAYSEAIRMNANYAPAYYNMGVAYQDAGNSKKAIEAYRKAVELEPDYGNAFNNLIILLRGKREYREAVKLCYQVLEALPENLDVYYTVVEVLKEADRMDEAFTVYGKALHIEGRLEEAVNYLAEAIKMNKKNFDAYYELGRVLRHGNNFPDAIESLKRALKINPKNAPALIEYGICLCEAGQLSESWEALKTASGLKIESVKTRRSLVGAVNNLGNSFNAQKKYEDAIKAHRLTTTLDPHYALGFYNLGNSLGYVNKYVEASDAYTQAINIKPDYMQVYSNLGALLYKTGQYDKAVVNLRKALELDPKDAISILSLAYSYANLGFFKDSEEWFTKGMSILNASEIPNIDLKEKMETGYSILRKMRENTVSMNISDVVK